MEEMIKKKLDFTYIKKSLMKISREGGGKQMTRNLTEILLWKKRL